MDLQYAFRGLWRSKGFALTAVACLALGIGLNTTIFSIVDGVLFRPLPFPEADRLASVYMRFTPQNMARGVLSMADYLDVLANNHSFEEIGAYSNTRLDLIGGGAAPEQIIGVNATLRNSITIAPQTLIGAGSIIMKDTKEKGVYMPERAKLFPKSSDEIEL